MRKLIAALFCMSILCFVGCRTNSSTTNDLDMLPPQPGTFNTNNVTFTFIDNNHAEIEYDPRLAPQVKKYFGCTLTREACLEKIKGDHIGESVQMLKTQKDRPGFLKAQVFVGSSAACYYIAALKKNSVELLAKPIPGRNCTEK